jgi:copper chaperone
MSLSHSVLQALAAMVMIAGCASTAPLAATDSPSLKTASSADVPSPRVSTDSRTAVLQVSGMGCPQCANNIDQQLLAVRGVEKVSIDLGSGQVRATLSPSSPPTEGQLAQAVRASGFTLVGIDMPQQ